MEVPQRMKSLPIDGRGIIIPFFVPIIRNVPEFKYADRDKVALCAKEYRCGICGKDLVKRKYYFIGGPFALKNHTCTDAPMHAECAAYAMAVCPHMFYRNAIRKTDSTALSAPKTDKLYLMEADQYDYKRVPHHDTPIFKFRVKKLTLYRYNADSKLERIGEANVGNEIIANQPYITAYLSQLSGIQIQ